MPLNRFITFVKPYLNLLAGAIAAWLIAKANLLGIPGLGESGSELQTGIAAALAWGVTQAVTQLGDLKWLKGHYLQMSGDAEVQAAALQASLTTPSHVQTALGDEAPVELDEGLPDDEEEFGAPPLQQPATMLSSVPDEPPYDGLEPQYAGLDPELDELLSIGDDDLPDDDEEFAAPPPDETNMPVQPSQSQVNGVLA